jgi:2,5-diketo-D-gluconate reductase A
MQQGAVIIRGHLQSGLIVIPKSITPSRTLENGAVEGLDLDDAGMSAIDELDREESRIGPNSDAATF